MNDQDRDLILALAAGQLAGAEAESAAARIASDPELSRELAQQRAAIEALGSAPAVAPLSADERTALRSGLVAQLNLTPEATPAPAASGPSRWWRPVMGLAAAAAVVVGAIVVLPGTLGGSDDSADSVAMVSESPVAETEEVAGGGADGGEQSADSAADAATTTVAASEQPPIDGSALLDATEGRAPDAIDEALEDQPGLATLQRFTVDRADELDACLEKLASELPDGDVIPLGTTGAGIDELIYLGFTDDAGVSVVVTVNVAGCEIVDIDR